MHQPPWSFGFDSQTRGTKGRSGVGVTEAVDVGVKNDLVRADVVLLKSRGVSMVAVGEALGLPIAVDGAVGVLTRAAGAA